MRAFWSSSLRHQLTLSHLLVAFFLALAMGLVALGLLWTHHRDLERNLLTRAENLVLERFMEELRRLEETREGLVQELSRRRVSGDLSDLLLLHRVLVYTDVDRLEVFSGLRLVAQAVSLQGGVNPSLATPWYPESPQVAALLQAGKPVTWLHRGKEGRPCLKTAQKIPGQSGNGALFAVVTLALHPTWLAGSLPSQVSGRIQVANQVLVSWPPSSQGPQFPSGFHLRRGLVRLDDDQTLELDLATGGEQFLATLAPFLRGGLLISLVALALALVIGRTLAARLLAPLDDLLEGTAAMARGHLSVRLPLRRQDELGALTREFNRMADEIRTTYLGVIATLAEVVEAKSHYTREHIERVERLAMATAQVLEERGWVKWSSHQKFILSVAAILHDVGKIAIGNEILNKPGPLTGSERGEILSHPEVGANIVERMGKLDRAAEIIRACHEHYDGSGYPRGLKGEEIPLEARIILAVDAYDAMTQVRPYSKARPQEEALAELRAEAGKQFDPVVVEALIEAVRRLETGTDAPSPSSSGLYRALVTDSGETPPLRF